MSEVHDSTGNIYADIGFANPNDMLVKAKLAAKIGDIIKSKRLTQEKAAEIVGIPQPKLSRLLRGDFAGVSQEKMISVLTLLGRDVQIVVSPARRSVGVGSVGVEFA